MSAIVNTANTVLAQLPDGATAADAKGISAASSAGFAYGLAGSGPGSGIGIVVASFLSAGYWLGAERLPIGLVCGGATIALFGYLDDRYTLRVRWKFLGQVLAVVLLMAGGVVIDQVPLMGFEGAPDWIRYPLTFFFVLGVINAVNMSDGLDGLAAGLAGAVLAFVHPPAGVFALVDRLLTAGGHAPGAFAIDIFSAVVGHVRGLAADVAGGIPRRAP